MIIGAYCGSSSGGGSGGSVSVSISDRTVFIASLGTVISTYSLRNDGSLADSAGGSDYWLFGAGTPSDYECRATVTSGSLSSGTTGSWLNLGTNRSWSVNNSAQNNSTVTCVITIEIRLASTGVVQDSATITLEAESDNLF